MPATRVPPATRITESSASWFSLKAWGNRISETGQYFSDRYNQAETPEQRTAVVAEAAGGVIAMGSGVAIALIPSLPIVYGCTGFCMGCILGLVGQKYYENTFQGTNVKRLESKETQQPQQRVGSF